MPNRRIQLREQGTRDLRVISICLAALTTIKGERRRRRAWSFITEMVMEYTPEPAKRYPHPFTPPDPKPAAEPIIKPKVEEELIASELLAQAETIGKSTVIGGSNCNCDGCQRARLIAEQLRERAALLDPATARPASPMHGQNTKGILQEVREHLEKRERESQTA